MLCTIHQPSSEVFDLFDVVTLLKDGRIMYQGPTTGVVKGFGACGFPVPVHHNPADYIMMVASTTDNATLEKAGFFASAGLDGTPRGGGTLRTAKVATETTSALVPVTAPFTTQLWTLLEREFTANKRDKAALGGRFGVTIFLNLLFGLIFKESGSRDSATPDGLGSHFGSLVMVTIASMFGTAQVSSRPRESRCRVGNVSRWDFLFYWS